MAAALPGAIGAGSLAALFDVSSSPPPETGTEFTKLAGALAATFTVNVIAGWLDETASTSLRVQAVPLVRPVPPFVTTIERVAPV